MIDTKFHKIDENIEELTNQACNDGTFRNHYSGSKANGFLVGAPKPGMGVWVFLKYNVQICRFLCIVTAISLLTDD